MIRMAAVCLMLMPFVGTAAAECLTANQPGTAEGRLRTITFYDLGGRPEPALILELKTPACLTGPDKDYDNVEASKRIHVYTTDRAVEQQLKRALGKTVQVTGSPFGEETVHHHAPIVMHVDAVTVR
jgi:hypothetical protein